MSINDYFYDNHRSDYERNMLMQQSQFGGLAPGLGMSVADYFGIRAQQAVAVPPPKPDPQTNPVLLLTGDDQ